MLVGKEKLDEEKYLNSTINAINDLLSKYIDISNIQNREIVKHRRFLWDNRSELDEIEINENCSQVAMQEQMHSKKITRIRALEKQLSSPYFARLDFKEDNEEAESFYIGLSTVEDEKNFDLLVFDWRSPISNMFYDFEIGPAFYEAPKRKVTGTIEFSRQYNIRNGKIVFMHDSNENLCDEALTTILGGNATDKMKNIVATIQKEQNDIIRNDDSKILFIQGAAGSGKTSIALHRSAYLLYKHRKDLKADNILIFSPNEVFADYISRVLPELGESNIQQTTFEIYSNKFLPLNYTYETKNQHMEFIYSDSIPEDEFRIRVKAMEFKNSVSFLEVLNKFIVDIPELLINIKPIFIDNRQIISSKSVEKVFLNRFSNLPLLNRLDLVKQSLFSQVEMKYLSSQDDFDYVEDKEQFYNYAKEQVNLQVDKMIRTLNPVLIYKLLWENINKYSNEDLNEVKELTLDYLIDGFVKYEDISPIIYIRAAMEGFRKYGNIKHLLIDEAQDYSPIFYELIKKSFVNTSITIMGDLNQRIDKYSNIKNKENITSLFDNIKIAALTKSYRCTSNITNFTKEILVNGEAIDAVSRYGLNPQIHITKEDLNIKLLNVINNMEEVNYQSIAIICKNEKSSIDTYNALKELNPSVNLIINDNSEFKTGINVITSYLSKGLEFDGVIIADGEKYVSDLDKNLFYTACTRALHELHIFSSSSLDNILPKDQSLYDIVTE